MSDISSDSERPDLCLYRGGTLRHELVSHLPFSVTSTTLGLILAGIISFLAPRASVIPDEAHETEAAHLEEKGLAGEPGPVERSGEAHVHNAEYHGSFIEFFHLFHPAHMLFSAAATTAMFRRYDRRVLRTLAVGFSGALLVCGLSDIAFPHLSLMLIGQARAHWHICLFQHPDLVLPFAVVGTGLGYVAATTIERSTYFSHALHVSISTMASIFYLIGPMGKLVWVDHLGAVFAFTVLAVMIPCCFSDIFYPLLLTRGGRDAFAHAGHTHGH